MSEFITRLIYFMGFWGFGVLGFWWPKYHLL